MSNKLSFRTKAQIWLNHKIYPYSEIVDNILQKFIEEGELVDIYTYWAIVLYKNQYYGVWCVNYPYADCNQIYIMKNNKKYNYWTCQDALVCGVRPSRKIQVAWWEWLLGYGYTPKNYEPKQSYITELGQGFRDK